MQELPPANWFAAFTVQLPPVLERWRSRLIVDAPAGIKFFSCCDLHVTLAFFGPVEEKDVVVIKDKLSQKSNMVTPPEFDFKRYSNREYEEAKGGQ